MRSYSRRLKGFLVLLAAIVLLSTVSFAQDTDTLINLVQWTESSGGNDHWYGIIPIVQPWTYHRDLAATYVYDGEPGHLATVGSEAENQFIIDNILTGNTEQPSIADEFYLGGHLDFAWEWITGEPFDYQRWEYGEPSGDGPALAIWGMSNGDKSGYWNDVPDDGPVGSIHQLWSIVEFGVDEFTPPDTLINLVQWPASEGGNDHWYGIIPIVRPWTYHRDLAETYIYEGEPGHLATIGSEEENQFIYNNILKGNTRQPSIADEFYLGGHFDAGWGWITGEPFDYQRWDQGEPSGDGPGLAIWGMSNGKKHGYWNDVPDDGPVGSIHQLWSIVEFGLDEIPAPDTLINLVQWTAASGGNDHWFGIIPIVQPWTYHRDLAATYVYEGEPGHLATIASEAENQFIIDNILTGNTNQPSIADEFYLGGHFDAEWGWITGETFDYQRWESGEPSGDGPALAIWGMSNDIKSGYWNDVPDDGPVGSIHQLWSIVEFGIDDQDDSDASARTLPRTVNCTVQNHPNPFNPATSISFFLPEASSVKIEIFNIRGQRIETLTDRYFEAGQHSVEWDSRNIQGEKVASGIYLYRFTSKDFAQTKKMVLVK